MSGRLREHRSCRCRRWSGGDRHCGWRSVLLWCFRGGFDWKSWLWCGSSCSCRWGSHNWRSRLFLSSSGAHPGDPFRWFCCIWVTVCSGGEGAVYEILADFIGLGRENVSREPPVPESFSPIFWPSPRVDPCGLWPGRVVLVGVTIKMAEGADGRVAALPSAVSLLKLVTV